MNIRYYHKTLKICYTLIINTLNNVIDEMILYRKHISGQFFVEIFEWYTYSSRSIITMITIALRKLKGLGGAQSHIKLIKMAPKT